MLKYYKIGDICETNKYNVRGSNINDEIRYLDTSSLSQGVVTQYQMLCLKDAPSRAQRRLVHDSIVYSLVRPNLCHYGFFENPADDIVVSTGFITLCLKEEYKALVDLKYIYVLLTLPQVTRYLHQIAQNAVSAYPSLIPSDIQNLRFAFPKIREQKLISSIFFDIDRKITLNREINRNLPLTA